MSHVLSIISIVIISKVVISKVIMSVMEQCALNSSGWSSIGKVNKNMKKKIELC